MTEPEASNPESSTAPTEGSLAKAYRPSAEEPTVAAKWSAASAFHTDLTGSGDPYTICIPPPNVTAALHMGHALNNTLQDILIRNRRMHGDKALWLPGTDHAGIATQTVVDKRLQLAGEPSLKDYKKLEAEGKDGRSQFIGKVQAWKDEYEQKITDQLVAMGASCDFDRQRFTMDPVCAAAVREAFFQLFKDGLIYRGKRLVNWDPVTQTALADDEVEMETIDGHFWYLNYPIVDDAGNDTDEHVTVATTRPETMLGDTAVAVNPNDEARKHLIGKSVRLPIVGRVIPIIGDDYVVVPDPDSSDAKAQFASGFLKVTPAHDPNDYDIGQRVEPDPLAIINIMAPDASISKDHGWLDWEDCDAAAIEPFLGLSREDARKAIVRWFRENDLLADQKPYRHAVGHSYRSHVPIEPYMSDQWYVKVTDDRLAGAALRAMDASQRADGGECVWAEGLHPFEGVSENAKTPSGQDAKAKADVGGVKTTGLTFTPERYAKTFQTWHENIRDWCISRQLWWGHRIPVWTMLNKDLVESGGLDTLESQHKDAFVYRSDEAEWESARAFICVKPGCEEAEKFLESIGATQDPDVLDTWFSSALWPMSTMGWPNPSLFPDEIPEGEALLEQHNPTNVLCTAREIITLWVSRMVMFNLYFRGELPFDDVFIHAMIQDGHGQKMSKSLGNGVDPFDIIHSHGSDAMRFTLCQMTTQTQDVRMPVDTVCPHCGHTFEPKTKRAKSGYIVAAPIQDCPKCKGKMVTSYGVASGEAQATDDTDEMPLARNTSPKFDIGQKFATKLWNATRFALESINEAEAGDDVSAFAARRGHSIPDRWILSKTVQMLEDVDKAVAAYDFHNYANRVYQYVWNDVCDWYIESVKHIIRTPAGHRSRQVLATVLDVTLRVLHPIMPFITERLWEALSAAVPKRGVEGLDPDECELLIKAPWPTADRAVIDRDAEHRFERWQHIASMIREVRADNKIPPREVVDFSAKLPQEVAGLVSEAHEWVQSLTNTKIVAIGPDIEKPANAAVVTGPLGEGYLHIEIDTDAERDRLSKRKDELEKSLKTLDGRLANKKYVDKAPAHLVQQTKDQRAEVNAELERVLEQLAGL